MEEKFLFEAINEDWTLAYSTEDQDEIDRYINEHPDIYAAHYRKILENGELGPVHLYFINNN